MVGTGAASEDEAEEDSNFISPNQNKNGADNSNEFAPGNLSSDHGVGKKLLTRNNKSSYFVNRLAEKNKSSNTLIESAKSLKHSDNENKHSLIKFMAENESIMVS